MTPTSLSPGEAAALALRITKTLTAALVESCSLEELAFVSAHWAHAAVDDCTPCRRHALDWLHKLGRSAAAVAAAKADMATPPSGSRPS